MITQATKSLIAIFKLALNKKAFLVLCLIVLMISTLAIFANRWNSSKAITSIVISGNRIVAEKEIIDQLKSPLLNKAKENINLLEVRKDIVAHPYIKSTYVTNKNAHEISIEVKERLPLAIVIAEDGGLYYTDEDGKILPYRISNTIIDLPLIRGIIRNGKTDTSALISSLKIIGELKKSDNKELYNLASEIIYHPEQRTFYLMADDAGIKILFGEMGSLQEKFELLASY